MKFGDYIDMIRYAEDSEDDGQTEKRLKDLELKAKDKKGDESDDKKKKKKKKKEEKEIISTARKKGKRLTLLGLIGKAIKRKIKGD